MSPSRSLSVSTPQGVARILPRTLRALEDMVFNGTPRRDAAHKAGIADLTLRRALSKPHVKQHYQRLLEALRTGEQSRNVHVAMSIRDDSEAKPKDRLASMRYLDGERAHGNQTQVNIAIGGNQVVQPGYVIAIPADRLERAQAILKASGSTRSVQPVVIDHE